MAKTSSIERNKKRERLSKKFAARRAKLRAAALNEDLPLEERFDARLKLAGSAVGLCVASALLICTLVALLFLGGLLHFDPSATLGVLFVLAMCTLILALVLFLGEIQMAVRHTWVGSTLRRE